MKKIFFLIITFFFICINAQAGFLNFYSIKLECNCVVSDTNGNIIKNKNSVSLVLDFLSDNLIAINCSDLDIHINEFGTKLYKETNELDFKTNEGVPYTMFIFTYKTNSKYAISYSRAEAPLTVTPVFCIAPSNSQLLYTFNVYMVQGYNKNKEIWEDIQAPGAVNLSKDIIYKKLEEWRSSKQ